MIRTLISCTMLLIPALGYPEPLSVFVSVLPQKTLVEKVGGNHVAVTVMVQPGHSPATYEPMPRQIGKLSRAALFFRVGVPFENAWMERIRSANPDLRIIDMRTGIDLRFLEHHEHTHADVRRDKGGDQAPHDAAERDPHIWTSPPLVKQIARGVRDALIAFDPTNSLEYRRNFDALATELDVLDKDIRALLADIRRRKFMVFHPSWGYFADTYGLTQVSIQTAGKEPGARALATLIEQAKRERVTAIFVQPQFDQKSATQLAQAIGARVVVADPLAPNYLANLRAVAQAIAEVLRQ